MKKFILLVFISSCNLFFQDNLFSQETFEVIMWFPPNMTEAQITQYRNNFNAQELDKTTPSQARLWRFPAQNLNPLGKNSIPKGFTYNQTEGIGTVTGQTSSINGGTQSNSQINLPLNEVIRIIGKDESISYEQQKCPKINLDLLRTPVNKTSNSINVAILDTGLECDPLSNNVRIPVFITPKIKEFIWQNRFETSANLGADNDGNGLIDDNNGWNFVDNNNLPNDYNGHGTAVAGIVIRPFLEASNLSCRIMPVKVLDDKGKGTLFNLIKGIDYATKKGADIISISVISPDNTQSPRPLDKAIEQAQRQQILVVCGAGNEGKNIEGYPQTPPNCSSDNLIVVGSVRCDLLISDFSNFGQKSVDLFAPGEEVPSLNLLRNCYPCEGVSCTGTSFSVPFVTGIAAALRTHQGTRNYAQLKCAIFSGVKSSSWLTEKSTQGGIVQGEQSYQAFLYKCKQ